MTGYLLKGEGDAVEDGALFPQQQELTVISREVWFPCLALSLLGMQSLTCFLVAVLQLWGDPINRRLLFPRAQGVHWAES